MIISAKIRQFFAGNTGGRFRMTKNLGGTIVYLRKLNQSVLIKFNNSNQKIAVFS